MYYERKRSSEFDRAGRKAARQKSTQLNLSIVSSVDWSQPQRIARRVTKLVRVKLRRGRTGFTSLVLIRKVCTLNGKVRMQF